MTTFVGEREEKGILHLAVKSGVTFGNAIIRRRVRSH